MSTTEQLAQRIANNPFLGFLKLRGAERQGTVAQLPFEPLLKNHVGTLHAGALFTLAHTSALAALPQAQAMSLTGFDSSIVFKRPSKGPVWASSEVLGSTSEHTEIKTTIFSEANEPLVEFNIRFESRGSA